MALKPCRECGGQVSTEARSCPHCGAQAPTDEIQSHAPVLTPTPPSIAAAKSKSSAGTVGCLGCIGILIVFGVISSIGSDHEPAQNIPVSASPEATSSTGEALENAHRQFVRTTLANTAPPQIRKLADSTLEMASRYSDEVVDKRQLAAVRAELSRREQIGRQKAVQDRAGEIYGRTRHFYSNGSACRSATPQRVKSILSRHEDWEDEIISNIAYAYVSIGMTKDQVIAALGRPDDVNRSTYTFGVHEQWVYGEFGSKYVYFEDGVVTSVQD
jgi:RNA polymerase subunit RPABC4/transcription elongation factor Spt4